MVDPMGTDALAALGRVIVAFMDTRRALDEALQRVPVRHAVRHRVGDLSEDLIQACELLIEAHRAGVDAQNVSQSILSGIDGAWPDVPEDVLNSEDPQVFAQWVHAHRPAEEAIVRRLASVVASLEVTERPHARAKLAYKHLFYVVRALQDALYAAFSEASGMRSGAYSSVNDGLKDGKRLRLLLDDRQSDYSDWFADWREKRNRVKAGVNFGITGHPDFGITINSVSDDGALIADCSGASSIYASDVTRAVAASNELAMIIIQVADQEMAKPGH